TVRVEGPAAGDLEVVREHDHRGGGRPGDPDVVDAGLDEAPGTGVGGLDLQPDRLSGEAGQVHVRRGPGTGPVHARAELLEHDRARTAGEDAHPQEVGVGGVAQVG